MPIPRMTARRWMIAVAAVAALLGMVAEIGRERELSEEYDFHARMHELMESIYTEKSAAAYHAAMRQKYDRAARYPFLPVPPDPAAPEGAGVENGRQGFRFRH